jgi:hypothetical protein
MRDIVIPVMHHADLFAEPLKRFVVGVSAYQ